MWMQVLLLATTAAAASEPLDFSDCELRAAMGGSSVSAECFSLRVPEDWSNPEAGDIELKAARVPATGDEASEAPLLMIAGGPGQSALESFTQHIRALRPLRDRRDIILVDQRGTGGSRPLACSDYDMESEPEPAEAANAIRDCFRELDVDPRHYTTASAVRDLEAVREALALPEWHVYGVSYGSRVGLEYLRYAPGAIATLTVDGVVPADEVLGPMIAPFAQQAVNRMLDRCAENEDCHQAFPDLDHSLRQLLNELENEARAVSLRHPRTHESTQVTLDRRQVAQVIRFAAYQPEMLSLVPLMIHRAAKEDDWQPLASQWLLLGESLEESLNVGMHYAVICSEDIPFVDESHASSEADWLGVDPMELLESVCDDWPRDRNALPRDAVVSDKPVLLLSGELDPVTPPEWGDRAAASLDNSRHITLLGKGHNVVHLGCMPFLLRDFLAERDPQSLDTECLDNMRPMPFFLDFAGPGA